MKPFLWAYTYLVTVCVGSISTIGWLGLPDWMMMPLLFFNALVLANAAHNR